jgi:hypothetical protein
MCNDESSGVEENGTLEDFAWMNDGLIHTAHGDMVHANNPVFGI